MLDFFPEFLFHSFRTFSLPVFNVVKPHLAQTPSQLPPSPAPDSVQTLSICSQYDELVSQLVGN